MFRFVVSRPLVAAAVAAAVMMSALTDHSAIAAPKKVMAKFAPPVGLAASHTMSIENGRMCFADHYHYGSSDSMPNARAAQMEAAKSWAAFVDFEYGNSWANFAKSTAREFKCSQTTSGYSCDLSARPCR